MNAGDSKPARRESKPSVNDFDADWKGTEDELALGFTNKYQSKLRYVAKWGRWYKWTGQRWAEDETVLVYDLIRHYCREALAFCDEKSKRSHAAKATTVAAVERFAKADRRHAATIDQWDTNLWLLNTPGGVVDLKTGELLPHKPDYYMTKITAVAPEGDCPRWMQFLDEITNRAPGLIGFLQRLIGYGLTGSTREHAFAFLYGTGANGKGTFLNTITKALGDYTAVASTDTFTESRNERHPTELAMLRGARFVVAQETDEGRAWNETRIKALTGGDPITARFMRQDFFTFEPQFKLIVSGNHKPALRNVDEAMRRRLYLVPFNVTIPPEERDPDLSEKLRTELGGILRWAIDGCLAYRREGLNPPPVVLDATDEYFRAQDAFRQWIEDCCDEGPDYWERPQLLFRSWEKYAGDAHEDVGSEKRFAERLEKTGFLKTKSSKYGGRAWVGLRLNEETGTHGTDWSI